MASEVSARQVLTIVEALGDEPDDARAFFAAAGVPRVDASASPIARISWDDYARIMATALERWGEEGLRDLGARSLHIDAARPFRDGAILAFESGQALVEGFVGSSIGAEAIIDCARTDVERIDARTLQLRGYMLPGYDISRGHQIYSAGAYAELPRLFHEPAAEVETEFAEHAAIHRIRFAHRSPIAMLRTRLARSRPRPEFFQEVTATVGLLSRRQQQLQAEADKTRAVETMLHQAQKMHAVGTLTGGIAHDFNNLLAVILGQLDLLEETDLDEEQREMLTDATEAARRSARLAGSLLSFSRQADHVMEVVDANGTIRTIQELTGRTLSEQIDMPLDLAPDAWAVRTDPARLENALLNLAINARDAMGGTGTLGIRTENLELQDQQIAGEDGFLPAGDYLRISVSDTGTGMAPELVEHAFEPFFTTKAKGAGTGLGLAMVWRFANESGGSAEIRSEPGQGTTVHLYLPRTRQAITAARASGRSAGGRTATGQAASKPAAPRVSGEASGPVAQPRRARLDSMRLLLLEDQEDVRRVVGRMLEREGYEIVPTADGSAALEALRADEDLELMLCDVMLQEGELGPDVVAQARTFRPSLRVVFMSGFAGDIALDPERLDAQDPMLAKPVSRADLVAALDEVCGRNDDPQARTGS